MIAPRTYELHFDGGVLARGFWLYIWQITPPSGHALYYVGRTGDSASANAQSPFNRMGQHLGFNLKSNVLRKRLTGSIHNLNLEQCSFKLVAYGPVFAEEKGYELHCKPRDIVAALEKALAEVMNSAGYRVINTVASRKPLDADLFAEVRSHFKAYFELLP